MLNQNKEIGKIYETYDYNQFKFMEANRKLNEKNYTKLELSMKEKQLLIPILVNEDGYVVDGQHRLSVCVNLGLPVQYYIVPGYDIADVRRANQVSATWTKQDFLNMHVANNDEDYIEFDKLMKLADINISDLLRLFSIIQGKKYTLLAKEFEDGDFIIEGAAEANKFILSLNDFNFLPFYRTKSFVSAFMKLYFHPDYDHKKMQSKIISKRHKLEKKSTIDDYLVMLTKDIYSFGVVKKPIYYDKNTKSFF